MKRLVVVSLFVLAGAVAALSHLTPKKPPIVLQSFSDSAFASWGLTLYKDGTFWETLPASNNEGHFILRADTIVLKHNEEANWLPQAYLLDRKKQSIYELARAGKKWTLAQGSSNWSAIQIDSTRSYLP